MMTVAQPKSPEWEDKRLEDGIADANWAGLYLSFPSIIWDLIQKRIHYPQRVFPVQVLIIVLLGF